MLLLYRNAQKDHRAASGQPLKAEAITCLHLEPLLTSEELFQLEFPQRTIIRLGPKYTFTICTGVAINTPAGIPTGASANVGEKGSLELRASPPATLPQYLGKIIILVVTLQTANKH